jgi:hypothetical protein
LYLSNEAEIITAETVRKVTSSLSKYCRRVENKLLKSIPDEDKIEQVEQSRGWQIAPYDTDGLLRCCKHIRLNDGFKLASYQFVSGGNGNGFAVVIPYDSSLLDLPDGEIVLEGGGDQPVIRIEGAYAPEWLRSDIDSFLGGDGSAASYFEASIFLREIRELGALWHGCSWSTHRVLTSAKKGRGAEWMWLEDEPKEWLPSIHRMDNDQVQIVFYIYTEHVKERVIRHIDKFSDGYKVDMQQQVVGEGGRGFIY